MPQQFDYIKRLGSGHFGEVWLAKETGLDAIVAVKKIPQHKIPNPTNMFQEAQVLKSAQHQNVVQVYDTGQFSDKSVYISMEYHPRGSLEDEAKGSHVELTRACALMSDVLRGLEHLHDNGILHRDVKPANILVGRKKEGILSDFGLAWPSGTKPKPAGLGDLFHKRHLAPEVWTGSPYDSLCDIYAAGVTLYRLVNGDSYLPSPAPKDLMDQITNGKFPNRNKYRAFITIPMKKIINKAMNVDPAKRFQSAREMRTSVEQLTVNMNWKERVSSGGTEWTGNWSKRFYLVRALQSNGSYQIEFSKGASRAKARRVTAHCYTSSNKADADKMARRILQDCVLGKIT